MTELRRKLMELAEMKASEGSGLVGGKKGRKKTHQQKVKEYMKKHKGASLATASRAVSGRGLVGGFVDNSGYNMYGGAADVDYLYDTLIGGRKKTTRRKRSTKRKMRGGSMNIDKRSKEYKIALNRIADALKGSDPTLSKLMIDNKITYDELPVTIQDRITNLYIKLISYEPTEEDEDKLHFSSVGDMKKFKEYGDYLPIQKRQLKKAAIMDKYKGIPLETLERLARNIEGKKLQTELEN